MKLLIEFLSTTSFNIDKRKVDSDKQPDFEFQTVKKQCVEESAIDSFDWFTGFTIHKRALLPRQCFPKAVLSGDQESLKV